MMLTLGLTADEAQKASDNSLSEQSVNESVRLHCMLSCV